jgi:maltose O-acetyltransferase
LKKKVACLILQFAISSRIICLNTLALLMTSNIETTTTTTSGKKSEKQKMLDGEFYDASDPVLLKERQRAKELCFRFNQTSPLQTKQRQEIMYELLGKSRICIESPFHVDYGSHLEVDDNFYANHGCTILDCNKIKIGKNCLLAPHVCISAATHPIDPTLRAAGKEYTAPVTIGDNVWIGANATICPGVTLGDNVVVGAGAVVTKDFPNNVVIGGVPAKILKKVNEK